MRVVIDARNLDADEDRARNTWCGCCHMALLDVESVCIGLVDDRGTLCGFAECVRFASTCGNGAATFMVDPRFDDKATPFERAAKAFVGAGALGVNPDDHQTGGTQEL